jgi:predicted Zn-dependent peptidase
MSRDIISGYWARRYSPRSSVVAVAGRIDHDDIVEQIGERLGEWRGPALDRHEVEPRVEAKVGLRNKDTEQAHLVLGTAALSRGDDRRWAHNLVDHILGGGMSSRLFREIREQRGLAYAVHSFRMPFAETGAAAIYVGTTPRQTAEVMKLVRGELDKLMADGVSDDELERAKGNVQGSLALSLEDSNSRMTRLGRNELTGIENLSVEEVVARIDAVTADEILELSREVYAGPHVLGAVGPFEPDELDEFVR